ncbi:hypothetical protein jhhlp_000059 [Lomentospora prolificans]|uniref:Phosphoglycerate mutase n=1 Tax=Lomentospora prolificans TaxID=41688 RepID=A0A2N3NLK2_9PEZI|nr:hypothetical protein jhhlp_000059 [Lomentospora prolificans]
MSHYKFTAVPGIFKSFAAECAADPGLKITTQPDLAILERAYETDAPGDAENLTQWQRLAKYVDGLNRTAPEGTSYKLLYLTRHGQGVHNVMHEKVGTEAWDSHWSLLDGDGTVTWSDAHLTPEGVSQATTLSAFWSALIEKGAPFPSTLYTSPLTRCLQTTKHIWAPICHARNAPFHPTIKELLREQITDHTCDRRSPRAYIAENFPEYLFEDGFAETDQMWRADRWEPLPEHCARKQKVLEDIFENDAGTCLSLSVHSFAIAVIMAVCGAEMYRVREGTSLGLLVKAEKVDDAPVFDVAERLIGY